jgi:hypothetical protein
LFPIGSSKVNFLSLFGHAVYKFIDSISQIALGGFVLIQQLLSLILSCEYPFESDISKYSWKKCVIGHKGLITSDDENPPQSPFSKGGSYSSLS